MLRTPGRVASPSAIAIYAYMQWLNSYFSCYSSKTLILLLLLLFFYDSFWWMYLNGGWRLSLIFAYCLSSRFFTWLSNVLNNMCFIPLILFCLLLILFHCFLYSCLLLALLYVVVDVNFRSPFFYYCFLRRYTRKFIMSTSQCWLCQKKDRISRIRIKYLHLWELHICCEKNTIYL